MIALNSKRISTVLVAVNGQDVDWTQCFCPGTEYAIYFENVTKAIAKALRSKGSDIYRLPLLPKANIPSVEILANIAKFSNYNRTQLLNIEEEDLNQLAEEAQQNAQDTIIFTNQTLETARLNYESRRQEMEDFSQNMTAKWPLIEAAQTAIIDASGGRRKRQGAFISKPIHSFSNLIRFCSRYSRYFSW